MTTTTAPQKEVFMAYHTDSWHVYASRTLLGVATRFDNALQICQADAKKCGHRINEYQIRNLLETKQTQGYKGEGEYEIEAVEVDKLL